MAGHRLIVGVDYGTTYSGFSYVPTDKKALKDIVVERYWPGKDSEWKTPTRIAYASENAKMPLQENQWGYRAVAPMVMCSWTKLLLDASTRPAENDDPRLASQIDECRLRLPSHRDAKGVATDFLRELYAHLEYRLVKSLGQNVLDSIPMDVWLTVPAVWSEQAKNATKDAAKEAGFGARRGDTISVISEPEAAAVSHLTEVTKPDTMNKPAVGDNIMICDCGGGTVDITSYTIDKLGQKPVFEEACVGIGAKCGSTSIDRAFHALMQERFGSSWERLEERRRGVGSPFMERWEMVKRQFGSPGDQRTQELQLIMKDVDDVPQWYNDDEGMVLLTRDDLLKVFKPTVQEILALIHRQNDAIKKCGKKLDRLVLVGGFGESEYLSSRIREWCRANGNVQPYCPPDCQAAIVRGAALRGLIGTAPRVKKCRRHYGCKISMPFRQDIDPESDAWYDQLTSQKLCSHRMLWMINKGAVISEDTSAKHPLTLTHKVKNTDMTFELRLYSCDDDEPAQRWSAKSTDFVGKVAIDFSGADLSTFKKVRSGGFFGSKYQEIAFHVEINFGAKSGLLGVRALCEGVVTGAADMVFD